MSFPRYESYKDSGIEWLGEVPKHWDELALKFVASHNDEILDENTNPELEILYVDISSVDPIAGISAKETMPFSSAPSRARRKVKDGDVIVSTVRTYLRAIARIVAPEENLVVSTGFAVVRPSNRIFHGFLGYLLSASFFIEEVISHSVGVSYPAINASDLMRITVPIPLFEEQSTIAAFLDFETAQIDALITEQQKLIALLKEKRQAVISHAVTKGLDPTIPMKDSGIEWLGEVPEHWKFVRMGFLFKQVKRQGYENELVLSIYRDFGVIDKNSRDDNNNKTPDDLSLYQLVEPGDLVINKMKAWQGSLGVSWLRGITSPDYLIYTPKHKESSKFLHYLVRSRSISSVYLSISNGIRPSQWRLEPEKFANLPVFIPPLEEQFALETFLDQETARIDELTTEAQRGIELLKERRSALISAAVTGKIDVRGWTSPEAV